MLSQAAPADKQDDNKQLAMLSQTAPVLRLHWPCSAMQTPADKLSLAMLSQAAPADKQDVNKQLAMLSQTAPVLRQELRRRSEGHGRAA